MTAEDDESSDERQARYWKGKEMSEATERVRELEDALRVALYWHSRALEWIDAVPDDLPLPAMPGFPREDMIEEIKKAKAAMAKEKAE